MATPTISLTAVLSHVIRRVLALLPTLGLVGLAAGAWVALLWAWRKLKRAPPGPYFLLPLIGDNPDFFASPCKFMFKRFLTYGDIFQTNLLGYTVYVTSRLDAIKVIWKDDEYFSFFVPGAAFTKIVPDIGHMQDAEQHAWFRRMYGQALSPASLEKIVPALQEVVARHMDSWGAQGKVNLYQACRALGMDLALDVVTGIPRLQTVGRERLQELFWTINDGLYSVPVDLPGTPLRKALQAKATLIKEVMPEMEPQAEAIIAKVKASGLLARALPRKKKDDARDTSAAGDDDTMNCQPGSAAASSMEPITTLEAQVASVMAFKPITKEILMERAIGNIIAAADTTRHMMLITLALTALSPRVYEKLRKEQDEVVAKYGNDMSYKALSAMTYLDVTIKEALRIIPAANGGFRIAKRDVPVGDYIIPKGGVVFWNTHMLHVGDPALLPTKSGSAGGGVDAQQLRRMAGATGLPQHMDYETRLEEAFKPERWLCDETKPKQYGTFGGGAHLCLGMHLAYTEGKLVVASLLRRFDYRLTDPAMLRKAGMFPGPYPRKGTDTLELTPRQA